MPECNQCGMCCRAIALAPGLTKSALRRGNFGRDGEVALKHWHRISREMAVAQQPNLSMRPPGTVFYACDLLVDGNKCAVHDKDKPRVCSGYPGYGKRKTGSDSTCAPGCAFEARRK